MDDILIPAVTHEGRRADFACWVPGTPRPQGSKSQARNGSMYEASPHVRAWRRHVRKVATAAYHPEICPRHLRHGCRDCDTRTPPLGGPLLLGAAFMLRRPQKHYRRCLACKGRGHLDAQGVRVCNDCLDGSVLREGAPEYHAAKRGPDLSKLIRAVEDSLTDAGVWADDGQVSGFHSITGKRYTPRAWPRDATGVALWVWRL